MLSVGAPITAPSGSPHASLPSLLLLRRLVRGGGRDSFRHRMFQNHLGFLSGVCAAPSRMANPGRLLPIAATEPSRGGRPLHTGVTPLKLWVGVLHPITLLDFPHKMTLSTCRARRPQDLCRPRSVHQASGLPRRLMVTLSPAGDCGMPGHLR